MKKYILFLLIILPIFCHAQGRIFKGIGSLARHHKVARSADTACVCQHVNTAVLFPRPPEIFAFTDTLANISNFTIKACIKNLTSAEGIRLTLNGEEQPIREQTTSFAIAKDESCPTGYFFSYTLTQSTSRNTVSLEARNEGGATLRYLDVPVVK